MSIEPVSAVIIEQAIDLRSTHRFKTPDAVHIATGILAGCTVFLTGDAAWARSGVRIVDPADVA